nr:MAG: hypothetical protein [Dicrocoelium Nege-like virius]
MLSYLFLVFFILRNNQNVTLSGDGVTDNSLVVSPAIDSILREVDPTTVPSTPPSHNYHSLQRFRALVHRDTIVRRARRHVDSLLHNGTVPNITCNRSCRYDTTFYVSYGAINGTDYPVILGDWWVTPNLVSPVRLTSVIGSPVPFKQDCRRPRLCRFSLLFFLIDEFCRFSNVDNRILNIYGIDLSPMYCIRVTTTF